MPVKQDEVFPRFYAGETGWIEFTGTEVRDACFDLVSPVQLFFQRSKLVGNYNMRDRLKQDTVFIRYLVTGSDEYSPRVVL